MPTLNMLFERGKRKNKPFQNFLSSFTVSIASIASIRIGLAILAIKRHDFFIFAQKLFIGGIFDIL
jgi:hypothetical protein